MSTAARVYRLLLHAYPPAFREEYGGEMELLFRDQRRARHGALGFWCAITWDVLRTAPALRLDAWRGRASRTTSPGGGIMKAIAVVASIVGALEVFNVGSELWAGGVAGRGAGSMLALLLAIVAGALLVTAGVALLRGGRSALALARGGAVACLVVFAILVVARPGLSIASIGLGILVPIVLLVMLGVSPRGRGPATA